MPGGPISRDKNAILVPTVLQIAADVVDTFTHLTCMYDKYWYNRRDVMTFPLAMFYVLDMHEISQTDVSEQRVILYEPQASSQDAIARKLADPLRPGVQEVIVDNAVRHPKSYSLDIIVPFQPVSKQFGRTMNDFTSLLSSFAEIFAGSDVVRDYASYFAAVVPFLQLGGKTVDIAGKFPGTNAANYINKESLQAMRDSGHTVTMKMWTGYDYKYVMITGLDFSKKPLEDDVFHATMQVKEMPVLTVTPLAQPSSTPSGIDRNWAATAVSTLNNLLLALPMELTQVQQHSGEQTALNEKFGAVAGTGVFIPGGGS